MSPRFLAFIGSLAIAMMIFGANQINAAPDWHRIAARCYRQGTIAQKLLDEGVDSNSPIFKHVRQQCFINDNGEIQ